MTSPFSLVNTAQLVQFFRVITGNLNEPEL